MTVWDAYPADYRAVEVEMVTHAVRSGECVAVIGLSGAGKSNLMGFLANRSELAANGSALAGRAALVDCNRLPEPTPAAFFRLVRAALNDTTTPANGDELAALDIAIGRRLAESRTLTLLFDRFDAIPALPGLFSNLRSLRDAHKYDLTFIVATRRPLDPHTELSELFYAHTIWLGPLSASDARWNVGRYAERRGVTWGEETTEALIRFSGGYPSLLRAACEACATICGADDCALELTALRAHPAVQRRVDEFWADQPGEDDRRRSGLTDNPLLARAAPLDTQLTAKEHLLLEFFRAHPAEVCEKDDLIRGVWPEDKIYTRGIRDDSLAQLIRRLREKIESDPSAPRHIHTVPGRGYRYLP